MRCAHLHCISQCSVFLCFLFLQIDDAEGRSQETPIVLVGDAAPTQRRETGGRSVSGAEKHRRSMSQLRLPAQPASRPSVLVGGLMQSS